MKAYDFIQQLYKVLPNQTNLFTTDVPLTSLIKNGSTVTAVSASPHGMSTGDYAYITGANWKTPITTIVRNGTVATATCSVPHDLTEVFFDNVSITGANEAVYNDSFPLINVPNRYTFTFRVPDTFPNSATGTMFLLEPWREGFNGWVQLTVVNATSFIYSSSGSGTVTASGTMIARKQPRISGAASMERAEAAYTRFGNKQLWAFVVMGRVTASKARDTFTDAISSSTPSTVYRQYLLNDVYVYIFVPTDNSLAARAERDLMVDVSKYLFKSLLGKVYPTYFVDSPVAGLHFRQHHQAEYKGAYYIHEFQFEGIAEITTNDIVEPDVTRAFRDLILDFSNEFDQVIMDTQINLDDQPV